MFLNTNGEKLFPEVYFENHWENRLLNIWVSEGFSDIVLGDKQWNIIFI